jgi:predicted Holliday junction resolvase-like endonuclease
MNSTAIGALAGFGAGLLVALVLGAIWKLRYTRAIRRDAVERSLAVTAGKVHEQLVPHLPGFEYNPKDVRFLGSPVDYLVFDGLAEGAVRRVVFLEVKTGAATLSPRERQVKDAVLGARIEWREWRVGAKNAPAPPRER